MTIAAARRSDQTTQRAVIAPRTGLRVVPLLAAAAICASALAEAPRPGVDWPQFRGIQASGIADGAPLPTKWSAAGGEGIAWKTPIPGLAHSSPVVWGDRIFVTTAVPVTGDAPLRVGLYGDGDSADDMVEHEFQVYCLDRQTGRVIWQRTCAKQVPRYARHTKATHCNSTPVTDGRYVVACFGAQGLFAFSMDGEPRWSKELGALDVGPHNDLDLQWGFASSPIIANGLVVLQCDVKRNPFLAAFDLEDGRKVWRVARDDVPGWSTPTALRTDDGWQIITNGCKHMGAVALADGKEVWRMSGGGGIPVPTPVVVDDLIYLTSNHRPLREGDPRRPIFAVRTAARGVLPVPQEGASGRFVAWMTSGRGNYMQTPLVYRGVAYFCNDNGALTAYDAVSGEELYRERLGEGTSGFTASGVAGDGKVYFTSEEGDIHVLRAGRSFEVLAVNAMSEICMSTPAISRGALLFRTRGHVACVGQRN